jgi:carbon storage regulator CsrA
MALVLHRRAGESIDILVGPVRVTVTLIETTGKGKARLAIDGPPEVQIHRSEIPVAERRYR